MTPSLEALEIQRNQCNKYHQIKSHINSYMSTFSIFFSLNEKHLWIMNPWRKKNHYSSSSPGKPNWILRFIGSWIGHWYRWRCWRWELRIRFDFRFRWCTCGCGLCLWYLVVSYWIKDKKIVYALDVNTDMIPWLRFWDHEPGGCLSAYHYKLRFVFFLCFGQPKSKTVSTPFCRSVLTPSSHDSLLECCLVCVTLWTNRWKLEENP